mmetsp:Transcript_6947/g.25552  ORF Transcript_6947/g.25552 Transcript_6947/m.25552 type:complete len:238 (-) Transcript_6947:62-775(-)|eukprot:30980-Pelagococcus_subviridis.AAC.12
MSFPFAAQRWFPIALSPKMSRTLPSSSPDALVIAIISASEPTTLPIIICSISFARAASAGPGPSSHRRWPIASRPSGPHAASKAAREPPHRNRSFPDAASLHPPLTGAARNLPPDRSTASPTLTPVRSSTVLQSTYVLALAFDPRDAIPATALSGPPTATASAALGSASIAKTTSHVDVTSAGVRATAAPSARKGSVFATLLLYTVMFAPAPTSLDAICAPMMPRPRKPTRGWEDMA